MRTILTFLKIAAAVVAFAWVVENPGTITIDWLGYNAELHIGVFILFVMLITVLGIILYSLIKGMMDMPKNMARYRDMTNREKAMKSLTVGLSAVAAGDEKAALYQSRRARNLCREGDGLAHLLEAQAARLNGDELGAARAFMALMDNKDSEFLGVRGLLQSALDHGDHDGALELGHRALTMQPKKAWLLKIVYDLEIKNKNWENARKILYRAEKAGAIAVNKANSDRVAMLLAQAQDAKNKGQEEVYFRAVNKAYKIDARFIPTVLALGDLYLERKKRKAVVALVEKTWRITPHPGLVDLWRRAMPTPNKNDGMAEVRWFERLVALKPDSVEGLQALASVLIAQGLWGEARKALAAAENIRPNVCLYKLWARLEERATHDDLAVRAWLEKAADAPRERVWVCSETGRIYDVWTPVSDQRLFNTIIWDFPQGRTNISDAALQVHAATITQHLLEAP